MNQRPGRHRAVLRTAMGVVVVFVVGGLAFAWFARDDSMSHDPIAEEGMADLGTTGVGSTPAGVTVEPPVVALDDWLFAQAGRPDDPAPWSVLRSRGPGEAWEIVTLPGAPESTELGASGLSWSLTEHDGAAVVTASGSGDGAPLYVWMSDGDRWTGGLVGTYDEPATGAVHVHEGMLVSLAVDDRHLRALSSADGAATWQTEPVSGLSLGAGESVQVEQIWSAPDGSVLARISFWGDGDPRAGSTLLESPSASGPWSVVDDVDCSQGAEPRGPCHPVVAAGDLLGRGIEVSRDGGASWAVPEFTPPLVGDQAVLAHVILGFSTLVEHPAGGWVGTISGFIPAGGGPLVWVVRSDDGQRWSTVLGPGLDGCTDTPSDTDFFGAEEPLAVGESVLVAFACLGRDPGLYRISEDWRPPQRLARLPPDRLFGAPTASTGMVIMPVEGLTGDGVRGFLVLEDGPG